MSNPISLSFGQILERLNSQGIEYDKKQMQSIFNIYDIEDEAGTKGVRDNKLTNSELTGFFSYLRKNYVEKFINAFSDITESLSQQTKIEHQEISDDNEFYSPKRTEQLRSHLIPEFNKLSVEQKNRVKELLYVEGRGEYQLSGEDLLLIGQLSQDEYDKIKEFIITPNRTPQYTFSEMMILADIPKEKHYLFNCPERGNNQLSPKYICWDNDNEKLLEIVERLYLVKVGIKALGRISSGERFLKDNEIKNLISRLNEKELEKAIEFMQDPIFSNCTIDDIIKIVKLPDNQIDRIKSILQEPPASTTNVIDGAIDLSALSSGELEIAKKYYNIPERGKQQLSGSGIASIAKLTDEQRQFAEDNGLIYSSGRERQLLGSFISQIAKMKSDELQDFISKNPNFQYKPAVNKETVTLIGEDGVEYTFDKDGLVSKRELVSKENLPNGRRSETYITTNYKLHTEQETTYINLEQLEPTIYSTQTRYFDENNNLLKTLTLKENSNNSYDASIVYPNGETLPLQYSSYNEETGIGTIERHFVSPEGVKTDYYYEDSVDGTRIVDYTITDAEGNILLNEHNTFQQISENEFISSSNDKIYKIEFKDGNVVITEQETGREHSINIDNLVGNPEQKNIVINYLKNIPASQLMFLGKQPISIYYDNYLGSADNGAYKPHGKSLLISHPFLDNDLNLFTLTHEWGHYIDLYLNAKEGTIFSDEALNKIYQEELANFLENTNSDEQAGMSYLMKDGIDASERVADANALRYAGKSKMSGIRDFYYQQYFPRTIARIIELLRAEEERVAS